jgi:FkbM family methyltransferase
MDPGLLRWAWRHVLRRLDAVGIEVRRKPPIDTTLLRRDLASVVKHAASVGFRPATVIDVGVANGTPGLIETFPDAQHILVEPLIEFEPVLKTLAQRPNVRYVLAAAGRAAGELTLHVNSSFLDGSSLFAEDGVAATPRVVPIIRLDDLGLTGPFLLKVDVQGAEIEVLEGAGKILEAAELVILEVSLFRFMAEAPDFTDAILFMRSRGFVTYDIFGGRLRPLDGALAQVDLVFVREHGRFRASHRYASPKQRAVIQPLP